MPRACPVVPPVGGYGGRRKKLLFFFSPLFVDATVAATRTIHGTSPWDSSEDEPHCSRHPNDPRDKPVGFRENGTCFPVDRKRPLGISGRLNPGHAAGVATARGLDP
jgi:hypothetical protein